MFPLRFLVAFLLSCPIDRRNAISSLFLTSSVTTTSNDFDFVNGEKIDFDTLTPWSVTLPLERSSGGTNSIRAVLSYKPVVTLFGTRMQIPKKIYKLIVDTGSPYLVIADGMEYSSFVEDVVAPEQKPMPLMLEYISGMLGEEARFLLNESPYESTEEIYGSQKGVIEWKESFVQIRDELMSRNVVLGVLDKELTQEAGGPLLGLVKRSNSLSEKVQLRPTFLGQQGGQGISSFQLDSPKMQLTLASGKSLIPGDAVDIIPLLDLRPLGDFVEHYACAVDSLCLDGTTVTQADIADVVGNVREIVAVFDSGLTGCLFTQPLWDALEQTGMNPSTVKSINIGALTTRKKEKSMKTVFSFYSEKGKNPFFSLQPISLDWFDDEETCPYVVVLGQTFLTQGCLTIDIDERQAIFTY